MTEKIMDDKTLCSLCGEGHVTPRSEDTVTEYRGQKGTVMLRYAECDVCGSEITGDADGRANKRAVLRFRKHVDGLLAGEEIRAIREKYGVTQAQAAKLFGGGPVAFSKYENDDVSHSEAMDNLLKLVRRSDEAFWELVDEKQMAELLHRRPARSTHYKVVREVVPVFITVRNGESPHSQPTKQLSYLAESRSVQVKQQWMQ
jgi:HTH-type transcriptional regulator/antitoxin MqsA